METFAGLGTQLRHVLDLLDGDVAKVYADLGIAGYRPRYSPVVRALVAKGPMPIRELARMTGVTHSAASQTAAQMARHGLLSLEQGADARQRIARLTDRARELLPVIEAEWAATAQAAAELEAELPAPLSEVLSGAERAAAERPMRTRIADAARELLAAQELLREQTACAPDNPGDAGTAGLAALRAIAGNNG